MLFARCLLTFLAKLITCCLRSLSKECSAKVFTCWFHVFCGSFLPNLFTCCLHVVCENSSANSLHVACEFLAKSVFAKVFTCCLHVVCEHFLPNMLTRCLHVVCENSLPDSFLVGGCQFITMHGIRKGNQLNSSSLHFVGLVQQQHRSSIAAA